MTASILNKTPRAFTYKNSVFAPGLTSIDEKIAEELSMHPIFKSYIELGEVEIQKTDSVVAIYKKTPNNDKRAFIENLTDAEQLQTLYKQPINHALKEVIKKQLVAIEEAEKKTQEDELDL